MKKFKSTLRFIFFTTLFIWIVFQLINKSLNDEFQVSYDLQGVECNEFAGPVEVGKDQSHERSWSMLNSFKKNCLKYQTTTQLFKKQEAARNQFQSYGTYYEEYWGNVYKQLVENDYQYVKYIADSLVNIASTKNLNNLETAELIVTFVQDIPYHYIKVNPCSNESKPCYGNTKYGILSPYEFLHTLSGDCDTRAVLLFAMLSYLDYDPMVVISEKYLHAMLALNIPATGDHLVYQNKKYYFWETTAKNWQLGILPPSNKNVNYWKVALVK